jgi:hypothetical protein
MNPAHMLLSYIQENMQVTKTLNVHFMNENSHNRQTKQVWRTGILAARILRVQEEIKVDFCDFYRHAIEIEKVLQKEGEKGDKYVIEDINSPGVAM